MAGESTAIRCWHHQEFGADRLVDVKTDLGHYVSVCLPARDEAATIGAIVEVLRTELVERRPLVDEIVVIDDGSVDVTARVAADAGASVVRAEEVLAECGPGLGKGNALWKSLHAAKGDLLVFCDADILDFGAHFVTGLLGPLLLADGVGLVKGFYARPLGGGRVTELVARPLLSLLFPHLNPVVQPLAGEYAGRRDVLERVPFVEGYGVDLGLLIDVAAQFGLSAIAQVDLGSRLHRNRPLQELAPAATDVLRTALSRAGGTHAGPRSEGPLGTGPRSEGPLGPWEIVMSERPPIIEVPGYRARG